MHVETPVGSDRLGISEATLRGEATPVAERGRESSIRMPRANPLVRDPNSLNPEEQVRYRELTEDINRLRTQIDETQRRIDSGGGRRTTQERLDEMRRNLALQEAVRDDMLRVEVALEPLSIVGGTEQGVAEVKDNPLNKYISVQYHIILSMIPEEQARAYQTTGNMKDLTRGYDSDISIWRNNPDDDKSVVIASTGNIIKNRQENNYYAINSLEVKNLLEPSSNNPLVSTLLSMKMKISEPHGFKLHEDIKDTAIDLGYKDINAGRILYRIDIYFSGYDQDSGEWIEQINLSDGPTPIKMISSVKCISYMQAEVTSTGTQYEVDFVPAGHQAYRPEDFILDGTTMSTGTTFRDFLQNLSTALKDSKENRVKAAGDGEPALIRNYEFYAPTALLNSTFNYDDWYLRNQHLFTTGPEGNEVTGKHTDILTVLRDALGSSVLAQNLLLADDNNDGFIKPVVHFTVRFNTIYAEPDEKLHDYKHLIHQYIIEPFISFKHGTVTQENIEQYVAPENQLIRIREMIRYGMLRRIYNYIFTEENTEVIDFDITLRTFYFETLNTKYKPAEHYRAAVGDDSIPVPVLVENPVDEAAADGIMDRLFGIKEGEAKRTGAARLGGGFNEVLLEEPIEHGAEDGRRHDYETYLNDYLSLDLLKLNGMHVRGDPLWLLSPYASNDIVPEQMHVTGEGVTGVDWTITGVPNIKPRTGTVVFLRLFAPDQNDYQNPNRTAAAPYPNIIAGFYQILSVDSTFEEGKFTQKIEGMKINNLNYAEEFLERMSSPGS